MSGLQIGTRVKVLQDPEFGPGPWPAEPEGRLAAFPSGASYEFVQTQHGRERMWWVTFDEPQPDADGDGPYVTA